MITKRITAETFPPGVFLEEELEERGWSQLDLAEIIGKTPKDVNLLINGKLSITPKTAIALSEAFNTSPQLWMNLETAYRISQAEREVSDVALKAELFGKFPVREMIKRNWIQPSTNIHVLVNRFCEFFNILSLDNEPEFNHAGRKSTSYSEDANMYQKAWLFRARQLATASFVGQKLTQARLKTCFDKLRLLLHEPTEIRHVPKILAETGIRLIIVEGMPKSKIDGATFWLNNDSPVVAISLRFDRIDNFWFTLMHELSHVKNGEGKEEAIIDIDLLSHEEAATTKPEFEKRADRDAAEFCIPSNVLENFIIRTHPYYVEWKIQGFAEVNKVHPGIVVGQLQHHKKILYTHHRKFLAKVRQIICEPAITDGFGYIPSI
jgi:HTH-type transcriptional regulator / antitoxin HigA